MKLFVFAFIMALMVAMIVADSSEEKYPRYRYYTNWYPRNQPYQPSPWIPPLGYPPYPYPV